MYSIGRIFLFRLAIRNPEIIYVSQHVAMMDIVIKQPPVTQKGKITWWEANEAVIKKKYGSPMSDENGVYYVNLLDGGNGFKKPSEDNSNWFSFSQKKLQCFDEIKSEKRCFENSNQMTIVYDRSNNIFLFNR